MENYNLMTNCTKQGFSSRAVDGSILADTNLMSITLSKPDSPKDGSTYYDVNEGQMYQYLFGLWHIVGAESNSSDINRFAWDANGLELRILHYTWWIKHGQPIIEWLEAGNGSYNKKDQTIQINSKASATYFKLKWD